MKRPDISYAESVGLLVRYWRRALLATAALGALAFVALVVLSPWDSSEQAGAAPGASPGVYTSHAAKFVCGTAAGESGVVDGTYATAINIHNFTPDTIVIWKKAVEAYPEIEPGPGPGTHVAVELGPDYAFEIDCEDIANTLLPVPPGPFYKGFVEIYYWSEEPLVDVVAVYTAQDESAGGLGQTMDTERIAPELRDTVLPQPDPAAWYTYSAKFVCGRGGLPPTSPVVPGDYLTAIDVFNSWVEPVAIYKKAVWAQNEDITPEPPSGWFYHEIDPNDAFEIDCWEIGMWLFGPPPHPPFYKGFVVIESPYELDVVGVYTVEEDPGIGKGMALDIEEVPYTTQPEPVVLLDCCQCPEPLMCFYSEAAACTNMLCTSIMGSCNEQTGLCEPGG